MSQENEEEMRSEYDIRGVVRGKYFARERKSAGLDARYVEFQLHVQASPWVQQPQTTESRGEHPSRATVRIGAEPIYVLHPEVGEPVRQ